MALVLCVEKSLKSEEYSVGFKPLELKQTPSKTSLNKKPTVAVYAPIAKVELLEETLDFTPNKSKLIEEKKVLTGTQVVEKIKYIEVNKKVIQTKVNLKKISFKEKTKKDKTINGKVKEEISLELTYNDIEIENDYSNIIIKKVAWEDHAINAMDYNKDVYIASTEKKINTARISNPEKSSKRAQNKEKEVDELVFFNYSDSNESNEKVTLTEQKIESVKLADEVKPITKGITSEEVPSLASVKESTVQFAGVSFKPSTEDIKMDIQKNIRETGLDKVKTKMAANKKERNQRDPIVDPFIDPKKDDDNVIVKQADYTCLEEKMSEEKYESEYSIKLTSVGREVKDLNNFEIRFQDNVDDIREDFGAGIIEIKDELAGSMNTRRGLFLNAGHYPTSSDLIFENLKITANYPLFTRGYIEEVMTTQNLRGMGGQLLVELDESTEDVDLDIANQYEAKLFLDKNFRVINRNDSDFSYILFIGVKPGNVLVSYMDINSDIVSRIIHIASEEMYYDANFYAEIGAESISLYSEGLLSQCKSILNVPATKLTTWNSSNVKISKEKLNSFRVKKAKYALGSRKYLKLDHLGESVYVGRWKNKNLVIPSEDYISHVLGMFNTSGGECLVQLNLDRTVTEFNVNGMSEENSMRVDVRVLDSDGKFYSEMSEKTKKIFITGEEQGIINIELKYDDGSKSYLQTYCSANTYLVEQI